MPICSFSGDLAAEAALPSQEGCFMVSLHSSEHRGASHNVRQGPGPGRALE